MEKLKAAILDDNKEQVQLNQQMLECAGLVTVATACLSAEAFLTAVQVSQPDSAELHSVPLPICN